jgi:hypothetical protein
MSASRRHAILAASIFLAALLATLIRTPIPEVVLVDADAGFQLAGARQIEFGEHPFIDYRSTYGPLTYYVSWIAQRIGGGTIAAELLLCALGYSIAFLLIFLAAKDLSHTPIALGVTAVAILQLPRFYKYYIYLGPALVLLCMLRYVRCPRSGRLVLMAIAVAIAGLYRPDQGAYAIIAAIFAILLAEKSLPRALIVLPLLVLAAASPWLIFLMARGGLENYLFDSTIGAAHHAIGLELPMPRLNFSNSITDGENLSAISYFIWWAMPCAGAAALIAGWNRLSRPMRSSVMVTILYAALSLLQSSHRSEQAHLIQSVVPGYALVAFVAGALLVKWNAWRIIATAALAVSMAISIWAGAVKHTMGQINPRFIHDLTDLYAHPPKIFVARLRLEMPTHPYFKLIDFIEAHSAPGEKFLALPYMTMLYVDTERPFAGGQMMMAPGFFSEPADQRLLIETLKKQGNPLIVEKAGGGDYDNIPSRQTRAYEPIFYQFVDANYEKVTGDSLPPGTEAFIHR